LSRPDIQISLPPQGGQTYINAIRHTGGEPVAAYCPVLEAKCGGLLLTGGGDIEPSRFSQESRGSNPPDRARDEAELALVHAYLAMGKPILGICRGMQILNVALGGDLIQDLPPQVRPFHVGLGGEDNVHPLRITAQSILYQLYGPHMQVNSWHHQAVGKVPPPLRPIAWAEGGFPEALVHEELPVLGVQFHPERMAYSHKRTDTADGSHIFRWFVQQCESSMG